MPNAQPYRDLPVTEKPVAHEFALAWKDTERSQIGVRLYVGLSFGLGGVGMLAGLHRGVGVAALVALIGWAVFQWKAAHAQARVSLSVEHGTLIVPARENTPELRVPLSQLANVEIESKEIQRVTVERRIDTPLITSYVSPAVDVGRIVLVFEGPDRRVRLTTSYETYSNCMAWLGKVRVFLRKNGWIPKDEREPEAVAASLA